MADQRDLFDGTYFSTAIFLILESFVLYFIAKLFNKFVTFIFRKKNHVVVDNNKYGDAIERELRKTQEQILYDYLHETYWKQKYKDKISYKEKLSVDDLKPVLRISKSDRKIHIVYSKKSLWKLAFSEKLEAGANEKFGFIFKGLKSWCIEETRGRFANVMQDLLEFRQVY